MKKTVIGATIALSAIAVLGIAGPASAHDVLIGSNPPADTTIETLPDSFSITMNETLLDLAGDASGFAIQVIDAEGAYYGDGCLAVSNDTLTMGATLGEPGPYAFRWQAVSSDGHPVSGEFAFTWAGDATAEGSVEPPVCGVTGVEPVATSTPEATPQPTLEPDTTADAINPAPWLVGGVVALGIIAALVVVIVRRRRF
ncbi:hypothetical protein BH10ACT7_BH10ACT7_19820 [soil metagenome]